MTNDELRELADALMEHAAHERQVAHDCDCRPEDTYNWRIHVDCVRAAAYLRECAAAPTPPAQADVREPTEAQIEAGARALSTHWHDSQSMSIAREESAIVLRAALAARETK